MAANLAAFTQLWDVNPTFATYVPCTTQLSDAWHMSPAHSKLRSQQPSLRANENVFRFRSRSRRIQEGVLISRYCGRKCFEHPASHCRRWKRQQV